MTTAKNPILSGFYPDPSICRVGKDFYLVNSSFVYFPGVPIFHSQDLAHWEQIGNILDRTSQLPVGGSEISRGIFAPTIRYHKGTYYMITTNVSHGGNFIVTAKDPQGPWSEPYYLGEEAAGIDPSLFFDEDDRCYYVGTRPNSKGTRYDGDWEIWVQEVDLEQMKLVGESMAIWNGAVRGVIWPEGPHLYKKDGYYYLLHAEGGTGPEHSISVARSKELFQWFEGCKRNPIFSHRNLGKDYPIVYAGHGDLVDDEDGNWYIVMLATRLCKGHGSMGRETFLAKVTWEDGWPVINPEVGKLEEEVELPLQEVEVREPIDKRDQIHFYKKELDQRLLGIMDLAPSKYSLEEREGFLRLYTRPEVLHKLESAAYIGLRQKSYTFEADCGIEFLPKGITEAGLVLYQNHKNHLKMVLREEEGETVFSVIAHIKGEDQLIASKKVCGVFQEIRLKAKDQTASVWLASDPNGPIADQIDLCPYTTEEAGGFVGCTIGMYASANGEEIDHYADFAWISMNAQ